MITEKELRCVIAACYEEPKTIAEGIASSMREEQTAATWYRDRARNAKEKGDPVTADLYEHIAGEEDTHYKEFKERLGELFIIFAEVSKSGKTQDSGKTGQRKLIWQK